MTFFGEHKLATYSAIDNHLLVTDFLSGSIDYSSTKTDLPGVVEGITGVKGGQLLALTVNKESLEYALVRLTDLVHVEVALSGLKPTVDGVNYRYVLSDGRLVKVGLEGEQVRSVEIADLV
jgi:hypothetical protein